MNEILGTLSDMFQKRSFSPTSKDVYRLLTIGNVEEKSGKNRVLFVNWNLCSQAKNAEGRLPLFTVAEQNIKWSDSLCNILYSQVWK